MFLPEFTITNHILKNLCDIEYYKSIIENTVILPNWEDILKKEAQIQEIEAHLQLNNTPYIEEDIKKYLDNLTNNSPTAAKNFLDALKYIETIKGKIEFNADDFKNIKQLITPFNVKVRQNNQEGKVNCEEILAQLQLLAEWINSKDFIETHPLISSSIISAQINYIAPFESSNYDLANIMSLMIIKQKGYDMKGFLSFTKYFLKTLSEYKTKITNYSYEQDYTEWIEYYTQAIASEVSHLGEKIKLMEKNTQIAKITGRAHITERQERIVQFINDFGMIRNKDFKELFTDISEDSVLRDLKVLVDKNIIVKKGSTKSSRYELK